MVNPTTLFSSPSDPRFPRSVLIGIRPDSSSLSFILFSFAPPLLRQVAFRFLCLWSSVAFLSPLFSLLRPYELRAFVSLVPIEQRRELSLLRLLCLSSH